MTRIGDEAFYGSSYITSITLPATLTVIGDVAFADCSSLTGINLPPGITSIPYQTFYGCTSLLSISIPSGVKTIEFFAFEKCTRLATVSLPEGLEAIEEDAFKDSGLTGIQIPASVTSLGFEPFLGCSKLTSISVDGDNPNYSSIDGVLFSKNRAALRKYPSARSGPYRIPFGVDSIGTSSFEGAVELTEIMLPSSVTLIGSKAFLDCNSLTRVTIPVSVTVLGSNAFALCSSLKQAVFLGNAPSVFLSPFSLAAADFSVAYYNNRTGFTSPTWQGYPTINLGDWIDTPQNLRVEETPGGELVNGGTVAGLGSATVGVSISVLLTISNSGNNDLSGLAVSKSGSHADDFEFSALNAEYLLGGESMTVQITFTPKELGVRTAVVQIASNDPDENPFELTLSGIGTMPEISIEQPADNLVANGGSRDFGSTTVGRHSKLDFTIKNTGTEHLTGLSLGFSGSHKGDFTVSKFPTAPVPEGGFTSFSIDFTPSAGGMRSAVLRVVSNDIDENPYVITLTGTGVVIPEISIEQPVGSKLVDGASKKSFGTVKVGTNGTAKTFTVKNKGSAMLTDLSLKLNGLHAKDYVVTEYPKASLAPGKFTTFKVAFKPTAKGTRSAAIHLKSNDADESPFDIKITGMGVTP